MIRVSPRASATGTLPRVSVVIPVHNGGPLLADCLESVLDQTGVSVDVTVVDDASTDDSVRTVAEFARRDPRVRLARHEHTQGRITTVNEALGYAIAGLVVVMEGDGLLTAGSLQRSARLMNEFPDLSFVYGDPQPFTGTPAGQPLHERKSTLWTGSEWIAWVLKRGDSAIKSPAVMLRRQALRATGGHRYDVPEASNLNLMLRLASVGRVGHINGPAQVLYPAPPSHPVTLAARAGHLDELHARLKAFDLFVEECHSHLHDPAALRAAVRHSLARDARASAKHARDHWRADIEPVSEYLSFARSLEAKNTGSAVSVAARTYHDLQDRLTWRRWRRAGI